MFSSKLLAITIVFAIVGAVMWAEADAAGSGDSEEPMRGRAVRAFSRYGKRSPSFSRYGKRNVDHMPMACVHTGVADLYRCIEDSI